MSLILNLKNFYFDSIRVPKDFLKNNEKINYVDIGASNIKNLIFYSKFKFLNIFLFEPDNRVLKNYISSSAYNLNIIDKGLWSKKDQRFFFQLSNQPSSSFFKPNLKKLSDYKLGIDLYGLKKKFLTDVDKLDNLMKKFDTDFIKIDTEGSDYEILLGAKKKLDNTLGILVESQFFERYISSKSFSEIEIYLRKKGFELFSMNLEKWAQSNSYNINTNIKTVWGDVLYFVNIEKFIERLKKIKSNKSRVKVVKKIIFLMVTYKLHDSSLRYLKNIKKERLINEENFIYIKNFILMNVSSNFSIILMDLFRLISVIVFLPIMFFFTKKYLDLFKYLIEKNLRNFKRLVSINLKNKSIFRNSGLDIH